MITETKAGLEAALRAVSGVRVYPDVGPAVSPPCAVLGAPTLRWDGFGGPTSARWPVYLIVPADDRASSRLFELLPQVADALDQVTDASVVEAAPTSYPTSGGELPAYEIQVEVAL